MPQLAHCPPAPTGCPGRRVWHRLVIVLLAAVVAACGGGESDTEAKTQPLQTGRALDVVVDGPGQLLLVDAVGQVGFATGARLQVAPDGRLISADGRQVLGWPTGTPQEAATLVPLSVASVPGSRQTVRPELRRWAPPSVGELSMADLDSWADAIALSVHDADGRRIWLALVFRKQVDLRWTMHLLRFNDPLPADRSAAPLAEVHFDSDGRLLAPSGALRVDIPAGVDGLGRPTLPVSGVTIDLREARLLSASGELPMLRQVGWGAGGVSIDLLRMKAQEDLVAIEVTEGGELRAIQRDATDGTDRPLTLGLLAFADPRQTPTSRPRRLDAQPAIGEVALGTLRTGWLPAGVPVSP